jgi:uncharacterized protein
MSLVYFDSSALVKVFVPEPGSDLAEQAWDQCDLPLSSRLTYPEVRAALAACARRGVLSGGELRAAVRTWERMWDATQPVELTAATEQHAGRLAERHSLSGADAVQLASALAVTHEELVVVGWDERLRLACAAEGLTVVPAA